MRMAEQTDTLCRIELPAALQSLPGFIAEVTRHARQAGFSEHKIGAMELALEETIVNIVNYSCKDPHSLITVTCSFDRDKEFHISIIDNGPPFNPLQKDVPDTDAGIDDRPIGGLGIFLVRELTDGVGYIRKDEKNILTITMKKD